MPTQGAIEDNMDATRDSVVRLGSLETDWESKPSENRNNNLQGKRGM